MENNGDISNVKSSNNVLLYVIIVILLLLCVGGGVYSFTELNAKNEKIEDLKDELEKYEGGLMVEYGDDDSSSLNTQTIICTSEVPVDLGKMSATVDFEYDNKGKILTTGVMNMIYTYDVSSYTDDQKKVFDQTMLSSLEKMCDSFDGNGYAGCNITGSNGEYKIILDFDMDNLGKATNNGISRTTKPNDVLKYFEKEEQGFTCKIK